MEIGGLVAVAHTPWQLQLDFHQSAELYLTARLMRLDRDRVESMMEACKRAAAERDCWLHHDQVATLYQIGRGGKEAGLVHVRLALHALEQRGGAELDADPDRLPCPGLGREDDP